MNEAIYRAHLHTHALGQTLLDLPTCDSTQSEAQRRLQAGSAQHGMVIHSDRQTAGRGRSGRVFNSAQAASEGESATFSLLLMHNIAPLTAHHYGFITALAVREALMEVTTRAFAHTPSLMLKWPNDILLEGRKVAGILSTLETHHSAAALIIGIGINLTYAPNLESSVIPPAALWPRAQAPAAGREQIIAATLNHLERTLALYAQQGLPWLHHHYSRHLAFIGQSIRVRVLKDAYQEATLLSLEADLSLRIQSAEGITHLTQAEIEPSEPVSQPT